MPRKSLYTENTESTGIFQAFADLMSNAFMILCLLLLLALIQSQQLNKNLRQASKEAVNNIELKKQLEEAKAELERTSTASPIIIDEKSGEFKFTSGSAELNSDLKNYLQTSIIPTIKNTLQEKEIDFIQIIGHTDGQGINQSGNLDKNIEKVAKGRQKVTKLKPGSNVDLGLMRALAVVQEIQQTRGLKNIEFRAYSAGQLYLPNGKIADINRNADPTRRRIEIRFIPPGQNQSLVISH